MAALRWANGALGALLVSISTQPTLGSRITISGENGQSLSVLEHPEGRMGVNDIWTIAGEEEAMAAVLRQEQEQPQYHFKPFPICHKWQLQDFLAAIREHRDPAVTGEEGRRPIELIMALRRSHDASAEVRLPLQG